jgi:hypothetical protein
VGERLRRAAERLRGTAGEQPGRSLGVLAALAVLGTALAAGGIDRLSLSTERAPGPDLIIEVRGPGQARSGAYRVAVRTMRAQLSTERAVASVRERRVAKRANQTTLEVRLAEDGAEREEALERIERNLDPGPLTVRFAGELAALREARDETVDDLVLLLLALPLVALVLIGVLGTRAAGAAALAASAAAAVAALGCELLGGLFDLSVLALAGALAGGALAALQLCTAAASGAGVRTLLLAGLAGAVVFASLGLLGVGYLGAIGLGGALGSLLAVPAALVAMSAAQGLEGGRGRTQRPPAGHRAWARIADLISWSRFVAAAIALLTIAVLIVVAIPATRLEPVALNDEVPAIGAAEVAAAAAAALLAAALVAWVASRRPVLAGALAVAAALPATAVAGLFVLTFQDGRLKTLLDFAPGEAVHLGSSVAAIAVIAALAAAQGVTLAAAVRRPGSGGDPGTTMARCGPAVTVSCLIGAAAGAALTASSLPFVKQFGAGLAAGMLTELLLVQALLAPAMLARRPRPE